MEFKLDKVKLEEKEILKNLLEFYQYDFNVFYEDDLNENGRFEFIDVDQYFESDDNEALFIKVNEKYAGFILISNNVLHINPGKCIEEFWIMPKYRKGMFTFKVLKEIIGRYKTKFEFLVLKKNEKWFKVINYLIHKNYKVEKMIDVTKWDEEFELFVVDIS